MRHRRFCFFQIAVAIVFIVLPMNLKAAEIYLYNGDKISGVVHAESVDSLLLDTEAMGTITIKKKHISRIEDEQAGVQVSQPKEVPAFPWEREVSLGYFKSTGNTRRSDSTAMISFHKKTLDNEILLKVDGYYADSDRSMEARKWFLLTRYAFSFGSENRYYNFYRFEADHDRFASIRYRLTPSIGVGYWFSDEPEWKLMFEVGVGVEHTEFYDGTKNNTEGVMIPRVFFEKEVFGHSTFAQDIILYSSFEDPREVRLRGDTSFTNPLNDTLSVKWQWINEYDTDSSKTSTAHDMRFISSLLYKF